MPQWLNTIQEQSSDAGEKDTWLSDCYLIFPSCHGRGLEEEKVRPRISPKRRVRQRRYMTHHISHGFRHNWQKRVPCRNINKLLNKILSAQNVMPASHGKEVEDLDSKLKNGCVQPCSRWDV